MSEDVAITIPMDVIASLTKGQDMPKKVKAIFALLAINQTPLQISKMLGISEATVKDYIKKYDCDGCIVNSINMRKVFLAGNFESIAMVLSTSIKESDLASLSPLQKITLAEKCLKIVREINPVLPKEEDDVEGAMRKLKGE